MDSISSAAHDDKVDPILVEALQDPRHRLTILRMELDVQKFLQNPDIQQFEFQHFPTSYVRLAAHRVAQHYGLQTMVKENAVDGQGTRILVKKQAVSKYPTVCLSDVPAKQLEDDKNDQIKIVIRARPNRASSADGNGELGLKRSSERTIEEREEEYGRARARIFSCPSVSEPSQPPSDGKPTYLSSQDNGSLKNSVLDWENNFNNGASSRVAIFRNREKDRIDPDYDRRYIKYTPSNQGFGVAPYIQKFQHPYVHYDSVLPQVGQIPGMQAPLNYRSSVMDPFCTVGLNQAPRDAVYMQWPTQSMMYAQSYGPLRHAVFQAPFCQQPLSFDCSQI